MSVRRSYEFFSKVEWHEDFQPKVLDEQIFGTSPYNNNI